MNKILVDPGPCADTSEKKGISREKIQDQWTQIQRIYRITKYAGEGSIVM